LRLGQDVLVPAREVFVLWGKYRHPDDPTDARQSSRADFRRELLDDPAQVWRHVRGAYR
jgi:hypothetical protein